MIFKYFNSNKITKSSLYDELFTVYYLLIPTQGKKCVKQYRNFFKYLIYDMLTNTFFIQRPAGRINFPATPVIALPTMHRQTYAGQSYFYRSTHSSRVT